MEIGWIVLVGALAAAAPQDAQQTFNQQYTDRAVAVVAEQLESAASATFRYRVHIVNLMQLKPGMAAAEIGARSGFVSRVIAQRVGTDGRVIATDPDPKMVAYMAARAQAEGLANIKALQAPASGVGLDPGSMDAIVFVARLSTYPRPGEILSAAAMALKSKGLLLVVDTPHEGQGATATGIDAEQVIALAAAAGLDRVDENGTVPGHYSLRFRKR
jgi:ubiquinone/menaquinone biosynthesis C-methylase UbiE